MTHKWLAGFICVHRAAAKQPSQTNMSNRLSSARIVTNFSLRPRQRRIPNSHMFLRTVKRQNRPNRLKAMLHRKQIRLRTSRYPRLKKNTKIQKRWVNSCSNCVA